MGRRDLGVAVAGAFALVGLQAGPSAADPVVTDTIGVGDGPFSVAVSPDGTRAYIANVGSDTVSVIDTTTNPPAVQGTPIGVGDYPVGVAVSPDSTRAYVTNYLSDTVSVIDTTTNPPAVQGTPIAVGDGANGVAVSPDRTRAYVTNYLSNTVSVLALQPSPPTGVSASAGDAQANVSWSVPSFTGGQPITSYTATASPGGKTCTTSGAPTCTIEGLTNGTAYTVTVTATNSIGTSAASTPSNPVTPAAPTPQPDPSVTKKQTLKTKLPKRIKVSGLTVITPANTRTNAGQLVRTLVRGGPVKPTAAGQVRYFTVVRGPKGKTSVRTNGYPNLRLKVTQKAPATTGYTAFTRTATYTKGTRG